MMHGRKKHQNLVGCIFAWHIFNSVSHIRKWFVALSRKVTHIHVLLKILTRVNCEYCSLLGHYVVYFGSCFHFRGKWSRQQVPLKRWYLSTKVHGVASQNNVIIITSAPTVPCFTQSPFLSIAPTFYIQYLSYCYNFPLPLPVVPPPPIFSFTSIAPIFLCPFL